MVTAGGRRFSPPGRLAGRGAFCKDSRWIDIYEGDAVNEALMATWVKQAAALPGWMPWPTISVLGH